MDRQQFKIIAVRPLKGCDAQIRKVLKEDTTYFFYNDYEVDKKNQEFIKKKDGVRELPKYFFCIEKKDKQKKTPLISISAIVGKNGDGKSTIVELMMRILNNFAYASGYLTRQDILNPVQDIHAILYYSIGERLFSIKSKGNKVYLKTINDYSIVKIKNEFDIDFPLNGISQLKIKENELFYTQINNYSLYAYNAQELVNENYGGKCWIDGIFHKNDSYQTPIVLNPWRENGNMDINKERNLAKDRLVSLFISDSDFKNINNNQVANFIAYKSSNKSKLKDEIIYKHFNKYINSKRLKAKVENVEMYIDKLNDKYYEYELAGMDRLGCFMKENQSDFDIAVDVLNELYEKKKKDDSEFEENKSFGEYLSIFYSGISRDIYFTKIKEYIHLITLRQYDKLNVIQIQRIILIIYVKKLWENKFDFFKTNDTDEIDIVNARDYILYKTISIFERYPQYKGLIEDISDYNWIFESEKQLHSIFYRIKRHFITLMYDIKEEKSHITLKIRQTLNYLKYNGKYQYINKKEDTVFPLISEIFPKKEDSSEKYIIDFEEYKKRLNTIFEDEKIVNNPLNIVQFLPPPIFETDIVIKQPNNKYSFLSDLSSGERQELYSTSSVIYHLKNIDSVINDAILIKYNHVNLIFEEIELYFHPEYQRRYVKRLIEQIGKAQLNSIKSINMCFVTHSPFILSDIPKNNVLFLKEGMPNFEMQEDTFGANIHSLLQNGFFLDGVPIGEFAKDKINAMFRKLHEGYIDEGNIDKDDTFYNEILLVSEPFIKSQLLKLYNELILPKKTIAKHIKNFFEKNAKNCSDCQLLENLRKKEIEEHNL